jgi:hypothetical protein
MFYVIILEITYFLSTDSVYVTFVEYNTNVSHRSRVSNSCLNNISDIIFRNVYNISLYNICVFLVVYVIRRCILLKSIIWFKSIHKTPWLRTQRDYVKAELFSFRKESGHKNNDRPEKIVQTSWWALWTNMCLSSSITSVMYSEYGG